MKHSTLEAWLPRLVVALNMGPLPDEPYYALWSMHLSAGYYDHSPGIAYAVALGRALLGEGMIPVRAVTLVLGTGDFTLKFGGFALGGIGTATFGAILLYALLNRRA